MLTSLAPKSNPPRSLSLKNFYFLKSNEGLSIIEILVAVSLLGMIFIAADFGVQSDREKLEVALEDIERAVKFSRSEAIVRNKIVRLKIDLDKTPITYSVESSDNSNLLLPEYVDEDRLALDDRKAFTEKKKKIEQGFIPVPEFQDNIRELNEDVKIFGVATNLTKGLVTGGSAAIYFYPTGYQDQGLIVFSTIEEMVSMEIESVRERIYLDFKPLDPNINFENYEDIVYEKTKDIFEQWSDKQR